MGKLIFILIFALALALFAAENTTLVSVHFLLWRSRPIPLALLIVSSVGTGALAALIATWPMRLRNRRELAKHRREIEALRGQQDQ